jgi:hypothetical protein
VEDHAQVPVAEAVTEEEEIAPLELLGERFRYEVGDVRAGQILDVIILGNHVAVALGIDPVHRAV